MKSFEEFFSTAPESVGKENIRRQWLALAPRYDLERWQLPLPVWAKRPFDQNGSRAWEMASQFASSGPVDRPLCIYIHIPFCTSKCGFCDSYSFKLGSHVHRQTKDYVKQICQELQLWSNQGNISERPISTVHLGGGTPTFLDKNLLRDLAACVRELFNVTDQTEWALESSVQSLTKNMSDCLHELGFRRLHIGVQSLEHKTRRVIGRRTAREEVLNCIYRHLEYDWVVSVDLICGLPRQTLESWLSDIQTLINAGVDGFSLYEILIYPQNRKWAERNGLVDRSHLPNYFLFQAGSNLLCAAGYKKNLFNHWANDRDKNVYFTYPMRREDLLAVGTISNGVFGHYHYRHSRYAGYMQATGRGLPGLEGGLLENDVEMRLRPLTTAILSGTIPNHIFEEIHANNGNGGSLLDLWLDHMLIEPDKNNFRLTNNGAWLAGNMISEIWPMHS